MSKRKIPNSLFTLEENNGVVIASVDNENDISFRHVVREMGHARIRSSRQSKDEILSFARFEAPLTNLTINQKKNTFQEK